MNLWSAKILFRLQINLRNISNIYYLVGINNLDSCAGTFGVGVHSTYNSWQNPKLTLVFPATLSVFLLSFFKSCLSILSEIFSLYFNQYSVFFPSYQWYLRGKTFKDPWFSSGWLFIIFKLKILTTDIWRYFCECF